MACSADIQIYRLRSQNALLTRLLSEEKSKTAKLRTELVQNFTSMIVSFTEAQDESWSRAVAQVQAANDVGMSEMEAYAETSIEAYAECSRKAAEYSDALTANGHTGRSQRASGQGAVVDVSSTLKSRLEAYRTDTRLETDKHVVVVDGYCERLGSAAAAGENFLPFRRVVLNGDSRDPCGKPSQGSGKAYPCDRAEHRGG